MLIGHRDEIEYLLTDLFRQMNRDCIGNGYLVMGTDGFPPVMETPPSQEWGKSTVLGFVQR